MAVPVLLCVSPGVAGEVSDADVLVIAWECDAHAPFLFLDVLD